mgnify:CR=1 FL=1|tara:strand:+ start:4805 stop:5527 length:723 start_codon:yes stop_codon:yes gene_type:complete
MKQVCTWHFIISFIFTLNLVRAQSANDSLINIKDNTPLTLRLGVDLSQPFISLFNKDFSGIELVGDIRINETMYISAEVGNQQKTQQSELTNFTTKGTYLKIGGDLNMYKNWTGMNNQVYIGFRISSSFFNQNVNNYNLYTTYPYWGNNLVSDGDAIGERNNLNAQWLEFLAGIKVQVLKNTYMGFSLRLNRLISNTQPENFGNLYIPGFNNVTDENIFGYSYNYTLTYSIPFKFKKAED